MLVQERSDSRYRTVYLALTLGASLLYIHYTEYTLLMTDDFLRWQRNQISTDMMTGLCSRAAYVRQIKEYDVSPLPEDLSVFMIDINGLKSVNDTLGHEAGDELICGAASCIKRAFAPEGKCFRTGGDEFVVMSRIDRGSAHLALDRLELACGAWKGSLADQLRLSTGWAYAGDYPGLTCQQLIHQADRQMYQAKAAYYRQEGRDRRRR